MSRHILISRPGPQGQRLAETLAAAGHQARQGSPIRIKPLPTTSPQTPYDVMIFISPTAVEQTVLTQPDYADKADQIIAVGAGTSKALNEAGIREVIIPEQYNSEGLLALPALQDVASCKIAVVKGEGGRPLLIDTLKARGAEVDSLNVYVREIVDIESAVWAWFWSENAERLLTCASIETLAAFDDQLQRDNHHRDISLYVASDRIAEAGHRLGYTKIINVGGASNEAFVATINNAE